MDALLKPLVNLMPARKKGAAGPPVTNAHRLLYVMRELDPVFVSVVTDLRIVAWAPGATERPPAEEYAAPAPGPGERDKRVRTMGCCMTTKGTIVFVDPNGLGVPDACVSRRDMRIIEACYNRIVVDVELDGRPPYSVAFRLVNNKTQDGPATKERMRLSAANRLPDVEWIDTTPKDEAKDEGDAEEAEEAEEAPGDADAEGDDAPHDAAGGVVPDEEDEESSEYEEREETPDDEPLDATDVLNRLQVERSRAVDLHDRRIAAQRWLAETKTAFALGSNAEGTTALGGGPGSSGWDAGAALDVTDREQVLRLALLVHLICDRQKALRVSA